MSTDRSAYLLGLTPLIPPCGVRWLTCPVAWRTLCRSLPEAVGCIIRSMAIRPTAEQITAAMHRAADAARKLTRHSDRIVPLLRSVDGVEPADDGWWHNGWIGVVGETEEWDVLYQPETDDGRLRTSVSR
jgi:hypothetical protein